MEEVWLGVPQEPPLDNVEEFQTSKIGGNIRLFRDSTNGFERYFECPKCHSFEHISLLAQVFAPKRCNDRIIYILTCAACSRTPQSKAGKGIAASMQYAVSKSKVSLCFAVRSQNFNTQYYNDLKAAHESIATRENDSNGCGFFTEATEWGDDDPSENEKEHLQEAIRDRHNSFEEVLEEEFPMVGDGVNLKSGSGPIYTKGIPLDIFTEKLQDLHKIEEEVTKKFGDISQFFEKSEGEIDDSSKTDKWVENYMIRIRDNPTQCIRWCVGGQPLRTSIEPVSPPPCPCCGAVRSFELQLTAPVVYFLTKDIGEAQNEHLHFSNVLVYTCSKSCNSQKNPYVSEYVFVEDEL